jgi:hypothetical protein
MHVCVRWANMFISSAYMFQIAEWVSGAEYTQKPVGQIKFRKNEMFCRCLCAMFWIVSSTDVEVISFRKSIKENWKRVRNEPRNNVSKDFSIVDGTETGHEA